MQTTDWFRLITDLMQAGIPMRKIGQEMGMAQLTGPMLRHYRAGVEPLHWRGEALVAFWCLTTGQPRDGRPMRDKGGRYKAAIVGVRPSHPSKTGIVAAAPAVAPTMSAASAPVPAVVPARRKPGPKPGARRKVAEVA
jgi:hypothetical protein